jgi:aminopeptidase
MNNTVFEKMNTYANELLQNELKIKEGESILVNADKDYIPFIKIFCENGYKNGIKDIRVEINQPEIDKLREKYLKEPDFAFKQKRAEYYDKIGAKKVTFNEINNPYEKSKLNKDEENDLRNSVTKDIPKDVKEKLKEAFDVKEIYHTLLNVQTKQPIRIVAEREHEDNIIRFVEYAYKNGSGPIDVFFTEYGNPFGKARLKYAKEEYITYVPDYIADMWHELIDRKVARLFPAGDDPEGMADVNPKRIVAQQQAYQKVIKPIRKSGPESQWNIIYAPTTMSVKKSYQDITDVMEALKQAATEAIAINRSGHLKEHAEKLSSFANKMNEYKFKEIHFYSVDENTKQPDGKTDLYVGMSEKSLFKAAASKTDDGISYMANTPTEEVFSSPDKTKTHGVVSATMPLCLDGNLVEGIRLKFENGKVVEIHADKNEELWKEHITNSKDGDMLGEVALVAQSPIFDTHRIFYDTLLDENATCHIALGEAFEECVEGALEITDYKKRQEYMKENNINDSTIHTDFMIGGLNVIVEGIKADGSKVLLIENNKFVI